MKRAFFALVTVVLASGAMCRADAGPVKHWGTFPGREVRAVPLRGDYPGREKRFTVVQGRDGYVYVRGRNALYRVLDADGSNERVAETEQCSGWWESQGVDDRSAVPRAICDRAQDVIIASSRQHVHIKVPAPAWPEPFATLYRHRVDNRYLTAVIPAARGGYWLSFGAAQGIGRVLPSGSARVRHVPQLGRIVGVAVSGNDLYAADDECRVAHFRALALRDIRRYRCEGYQRSVQVATAADGAVWVLGSADLAVERRGPDGSRRRYRLTIFATSIALTHDGSAYVLGRASSEWGSHPMIAVIEPGRAPQARVLPMNGADSIFVDGRDRLWISAPYEHAFAVIAPQGAWG